MAPNEPPNANAEIPMKINAKSNKITTPITDKATAKNVGEIPVFIKNY